MHNWSVELFDNSVAIREVAMKFSKAFPQRTPTFFVNIIDSLHEDRSKLFVLKVDKDIHGAFFSFRIYGYEANVWSPSYLFVEYEFRSISLMFLMKAFRHMADNVINVSPTSNVKKILKSIKYHSISNGSYLTPNIFGLIGLFSRRESKILLKEDFSPIRQFIGRKDLIWLYYEYESTRHYICLKQTSRYGIRFFILVYFNKSKISDLQEALAVVAFKLNFGGVIIVPNIGQSRTFFSVSTKKFHAFSNMKMHGDIFSILGSEVTDAIF